MHVSFKKISPRPRHSQPKYRARGLFTVGIPSGRRWRSGFESAVHTIAHVIDHPLPSW